MRLGGQCYAPAALPQEKDPVPTYLTGGMVVLGTGLDRRGQSDGHRGSNPKPPIL